MTDEPVLYAVNNGIATITLNRPDKANTLRVEITDGLNQYLATANRDPDVKVIVLEGAGDNFCGGFDFSGGLEHYESVAEANYDPGVDVQNVINTYLSYIPQFMGLWRGLKPTIAKVHGYCVGGGSELALCADLLIAADDARFGTPYARVWGCHLTGMWVYRLGLSKAKYYALTGDWVSGKDAASMELINFSYPLEELDDQVQGLVEKLVGIPSTQLSAMKLIVNQAYDNMGLTPRAPRRSDQSSTGSCATLTKAASSSESPPPKASAKSSPAATPPSATTAKLHLTNNLANAASSPEDFGLQPPASHDPLSGGDYATTGFNDETDDAATALNHLAKLEGIDAGRIAVIGHSAGATIAIRLRTRRRCGRAARGYGLPRRTRARMAKRQDRPNTPRPQLAHRRHLPRHPTTKPSQTHQPRRRAERSSDWAHLGTMATGVRHL